MLLQPFTALAQRRRTRRGFTLIELLAVVVIIGITAALATPTLVEQLRERRSRGTAQQIAVLYSEARMRALGRGAAVLVQYRSGAGFTVRESIEGVTAATLRGKADCADQPGLGCLSTNWETDSREVGRLTAGSELSIVAHMGSDQPAEMNICFTPLGRSFISFDDSPFTTAMAGVATIDVQRGKGLRRTVAILPNGIARMAL